MIKKLQLKFVALCMLSLLVVLAVIIAGINVVNYNHTVRQADELLVLLSENKGRFPGFGGPGGGGPGGRLPPNMSPEIPYETRYFTVTLQADSGRVIRTDTGRIAAVNSATAMAYAEQAKKEQGFVEDFRYLRCTEAEEVQIIFLDCGRRLESCQNFLLASVSISAAGYLVVFLLVLFFSNQIIRPISESYEKQKQFITDAGHELKTPLTIIGADADVLELELGKNEWLEDIKKQTRRLSDLTGDLVYLSRMEEGQRALPMILFPISDMVTEAAQSFQSLAQAQGKTFCLTVAPMLSIQGNEKAVNQLVSILLDNALKYTPQGGQIRLVLEKQGRNVVLTVSNSTTTALPRQQLLKLFDRFYRGDSSRSTQGHGIGLSIAKAIVAAHGGKIAANVPAENTLCITAQFPIATA